MWKHASWITAIIHEFLPHISSDESTANTIPSAVSAEAVAGPLDATVTTLKASAVTFADDQSHGGRSGNNRRDEGRGSDGAPSIAGPIRVESIAALAVNPPLASH